MRAQLSGQEKKRKRRCGVKGENTMSVSVEKKPFGVTKDGEAVSVYCIRNEALAVEIVEYGAAIRSLRVHHGGAWTDAVLGYDTLREYEENDGYLGACIGRVGNRIGGAAFTLNGKDYRLAGTTGRTICTAACAALINMYGLRKCCRTAYGSRAYRRMGKRGIPARCAPP